ncbi:hypothetical protein JL721_12426 [Aureococcus anophagefferens]|nr:hypothetical protein JL721_12426 [Aureococcus anophagefferens]
MLGRPSMRAQSAGRRQKQLDEGDISTSIYEGADLERLRGMGEARTALIKKVRRLTDRIRRQMAKNATINGSWYKLFKNYDKNNSGDITFDELRYVVYKELEVSKLEMAPRELRLVWSVLDRNGDNSVTIEEFASFMRRLESNKIDHVIIEAVDKQLLQRMKFGERLSHGGGERYPLMDRARTADRLFESDDGQPVFRSLSEVTAASSAAASSAAAAAASSSSTPAASAATVQLSTMSLGWNTESALMPSKAKKIEAPKGSMAGLKSQVFKTSLDAAAQASGGGRKYARGTATARRGGADDLDNAGRKRPKLARSWAAAPRGGGRARGVVAAEARGQGAALRGLKGRRGARARRAPRRLRGRRRGSAGSARRRVRPRAAARRGAAARARRGRGPRRRHALGLEPGRRGAGARRDRQGDAEVARRRPPAEDAPAPVDGGVKSQWEKTLHRSAKGHLDEIHAEAEKERAAPLARARARVGLARCARLAARDDDDDGAA